MHSRGMPSLHKVNSHAVSDDRALSCIHGMDEQFGANIVTKERRTWLKWNKKHHKMLLIHGLKFHGNNFWKMHQFPKIVTMKFP